MADRLVKVSDLSGEIIEGEGEHGQLIVEGYPEFADTAVTLDVKPEEVEGEIPEDGDLVVLTYLAPGATSPHRFFMERSVLDKLAGGRQNMQDALDSALRSQKVLEPRRGRRRRQQQAPAGEKTDYSSPEHAGEPHRGRATEKEQEYVRTHLDEVNERLAREGLRQIDPSDPKMAERYGLTSG
jgi:hypothetical protein